MPTRTFAVAAAVVGAAALATTGITYASTAGSPQAAQPAHRAAPAPAHRAPAPAHRAAPPVQHPAPATAPLGGSGEDGKKDEGRDRDREGRDREGRDRDREGGRRHERREEGRIYFNERTYSAFTEGCVTAASGLGSSSFSIFNDSKKVVEVYRGFTCDNGAPVATVGPYGATNGVVTRTFSAGQFGDTFNLNGGGFGDDGVVGSFRVIGHHDDW
ncbi:hypothetical protein [Streptomyces sp. TP-A0356]|uniref:hypothetical protein n=1 Tax=Streptomyces sp. TP-A0356 TaxID=1359208 RepID=UPI0006E399EB|nr:hypothetical protein [Streptomyces sp. TP-A0356]